METNGKNNCRIEIKPKNFNEFIRSGYFWKPFLGVVIGGLAGFLFHRYYGCAQTPCPFGKEFISSIAMGSFWGFFLVKRPCSSCN